MTASARRSARATANIHHIRSGTTSRRLAPSGIQLGGTFVRLTIKQKFYLGAGLMAALAAASSGVAYLGILGQEAALRSVVTTTGALRTISKPT